MRSWLLLPLVTAVVLMGVLIQPPPSILSDASGRFLASLATLPGLAFAGVVLTALFQRRWRSALNWLGLSCLLAALLAGVPLWVESRQTLWEVGERYSLRGWYIPWFIGAYLTGWVLLIVLPTKAVLGRARLWWTTNRKRSVQ